MGIYGLAALLGGFLLDMLLGDPHGMPHPVCWMGKMVAGGERFLRKRSCRTQQSEQACGTLLSILVMAAGTAVPALVLFAAWKAGIWFWFGMETFMCFQILAGKSLRREAMKVYHALSKGDMQGARRALSMIVGRDTVALSGPEIIRAAVETVAENTSDGVCAPMFYILIGAAPLGWLYKAVNTLDSMIGYKNERYLHFGRFAARMDDVFNFVPARLTGIFMVWAARLTKMDARGAWRIFRRDRLCHASPNSAQTEAACAGALGVRLAGDAVYFGKKIKKPYIGDACRSIEREDIKRACRLSAMTSLLFLAVAGAFYATVIWAFTEGGLWKI